VAETDNGLVLSLRRLKTDQEAQGSKVALPCGSHPETCSVRSCRAWKLASGITEGAVFRGINNAGSSPASGSFQFGGAHRENGRAVPQASIRSVRDLGKRTDSGSMRGGPR
jgi:hypothetical protein